MPKKDIAVIDFGSSKITMLVGRKNVNNNFKILSSKDIEYAGFMEGEFLEHENLLECIHTVYNNVCDDLHKKIKDVFVGVPAEFSYSINKELKLEFQKPTKIKKSLIDSLLSNAQIVSGTHQVINVCPLYYLADDKKLENPIGKKCSSLVCYASFMLVENNFIETIKAIVNSLGLNNYILISQVLAESQYLLNDKAREKTSILVDCGYITTSVSLVQGEGVHHLKSFSLGGGHITAELFDKLDIDFYLAEQLKQQILINLDNNVFDNYEIYNGNQIQKISVSKANNIALAQIDMIISYIEKSIQSFEIQPNVDSNLYLTGGGISYIKNIDSYISQMTGYNTYIIKPKSVEHSKVELSSVISLLDAGIKQYN